MEDVGDFTPSDNTDPDADPDVFQFCGTKFEIPANVGVGSLLRFTWRLKSASEQQSRGDAAYKKALTDEGRARAKQMSGRGELDGSAAIYDLLQAVLGEDQIDEFTRLSDRYGVTVTGLLQVCNQIQGAIADRPTRQSAGSSGGLSTTGTGSTVSGSGDSGPTPNQKQRALIAQMSGPADEVAGSYA